jgi:hypothetical protein
MSDQLGEASFKEKPDISQVFLRHLDRTNQYAGTAAYATLVIQKLNNLPMYWQNFVKSQSDKYAKDRPKYIYKAPCGIRLGTKENPMLRDPQIPVKRLQGEIDWSDPNIIDEENIGTEDAPDIVPVLKDESIPVKRLLGPINWDDPNIYSPRLEIKEYVDYVEMDALIMMAAEFAGLTWQAELKLVDGGDTVEQIKRKKTPYRIPRENAESS